jgi:hypothetical protein
MDIDTEGRLAATESVLEISLEEDEFIGYSNDEGSAHDKTVYIGRKTYEELGRPLVITVRIVPGDTLNVPEEES